MTLADAQAAIAGGTPFGSLYPLLSAADGDALRAWFVRAEGVPANPVPVPKAAPPARAEPDRVSAEQARAMGCSGEPCGNCGGSRTVRAGACLRCEDCGASGCS